MSSIATSMNTGDLPRQNQSVNVDGTKDTSNNVHDASITMFQPTRNYNDNESNSDTETSNENMLFPSSQTEIGGDRIDDESDNPGRANIRVTAQKTQMVNEDRPESNNVQQNVPKKLSPACPHCRKHKVGCKHRYFINVDESMSTSKNRPRKRKNNSNANNNTSPATSTRMAKNGIPTKKPRQIRFENEETGSIPRKRKLSRVTEEDEEEQEVDSDVYIPSESPPRNQQAKRGQKPNAERLGLNNTTSSSDRKAGKAPVMTESAVELAGPSRLGGFSADNLQGAIHLSRHTTLSRELQQRLEDCEIKWGAAIDSLHSAKSLLDGWVESWQRGL